MTIYWKERHQPQDYPFTDKKLKKENKLIMKKKLDLVVPSQLVDEVISHMKDYAQIKIPYTRIEWPKKVTIVKNINLERPECDMIYCDDMESAKKLRTELIRSLELLNFYIDQVEETGEIRYVR